MLKELENDLNLLRKWYKLRLQPSHQFNPSDLDDEMLDWAKQQDTSGDPTSLLDAVRKSAAQLILSAQEAGMSPGWEVYFFPPEQTTHEASGRWRICWEAGPTAWAPALHPILPFHLREGAGWYTEPYHTFDLCFFEN